MIIVAGSLRVPEGRIEEVLPVAIETMRETRKEDGCLVYTFAWDMEVKGLIRIYEEWQSRSHLDAHGAQPHMTPWRDKLAEVGATERHLLVYEAGVGEPL